MKQLEMELGGILELHVEDCKMVGTVVEGDRFIRQSKISIRPNTLPEVIKFLQEVEEKTCK